MVPTDPGTTAPEPEGPSSESEPAATPQFFHGKFIIRPGQPIELTSGEEPPPNLTDEQRALIDPIRTTLAAYRDAVRDLLAAKYRDLADLAPAHMRVPCDCTVFICDDGLIYGGPTCQAPFVALRYPRPGSRRAPAA